MNVILPKALLVPMVIYTLGFAHSVWSETSMELTLDVITLPDSGMIRNSCHEQINISGAMVTQRWIVLRAGTLNPGGGMELQAPTIECGKGSFSTVATDPASNVSPPSFYANVNLSLRIEQVLQEDRVLNVASKVTLHGLSGSDDAGNPVYQTTESEREMHFIESGAAFIPMILSEVEELSGLETVRYLRLKAALEPETEYSVYGALTVESDIAGAPVFLDGGMIGRISERSEITVENVRAGLHLVSVKSAVGREVRKAVRVVPNRTVRVNLSMPDSDRNSRPYQIEPLGPNAEGYEEYHRSIDGATVVRIPAGEFLMGNRDTERSPREHRVWVSQFLMDKTGVTWAQYKHFAADTGSPLPRNVPFWGIHDDHPVVYVTWENAREYCHWAGGRLPTEAEREKAARGQDDRKFSWGDQEPTPQLGVFRRSWGYEGTAAVGTHPAGKSPYGLLDMSGNVWEWCSDWYDDDYYAESPYRDPTGPPTGIAHVVRGGSWDSRPDVLSASCRSWGHRGYSEGDFGFRCAMNWP